MNILALDASAQTATVALAVNGEIFQMQGTDERAHADQLLPLITKLLATHNCTLEQIDGFAFGRGPGGFTGLRIAAAVIQGLAYSVSKPVAAVSTLAAIAQPHIEQGSILVCTDARKSEVYCGVFEADDDGLARTGSAEVVIDALSLGEPYRAEFGAGNGFECYPELEKQVNKVISTGLCEARWIAYLAAQGWAEFGSTFEAQPVYVRNTVTHGA